jgi:hypothetical protein
MSQLDPRVPKLEALLDRILTRAAEPRAVAVAAPAPAPAPAAVVPAAPAPKAPPVAPEPASMVRPAPQTLAGSPSRRSHGALPAFTPPQRSPGSEPALPAAEIDHKTPVPPASATPTPTNLLSDPVVSAIRLDVDPSVDALLASDADYDDATIQANVEHPSHTLAGVGLPNLPRTPVPEAPASAPRAIEAAFDDEEDRRHTPPPESGKQKSPSLTPLAGRSGELPRRTDDAPDSREDGTLVGVGGGLGAVAARVTGSVLAETLQAAVTGPSVFTASLPRTTVTATVEGKAPSAAPRTFGELVDAALSL